jgi:hypothetical protein
MLAATTRYCKEWSGKEEQLFSTKKLKVIGTSPQTGGILAPDRKHCTTF